MTTETNQTDERSGLESTHPDFKHEYETDPKPRRRIRRRVLAVVAAAIVAAGGFFYVQTANGDDEASTDETAETAEASGDEGAEKGEQGEGEEEVTLVPVEVAQVERGSIAEYISATANLVPETEVKIVAEAEGRIESLLVEEGDVVRKGQPLVRLASGDAEIALSKAKARAANAEMAFSRAETMRAQEVISKEEFDRLAMEDRVAKQEVAESEWQLSKRTIRAPFAGQVTERFVNLGHNVKIGEELFNVASYDPLVARIYLPEKDVIGLEVGREVALALAAATDVRFSGRIQMISPVVDTATGTVKVTVEAIEKPDAVRPGGFVTVRIVRERKDQVVVVPRDSVIRELNTAHVFVADGDTAVKRKVSIGMEESERVEVVEGLDSGEQVVTAGQGALKDGDKIKVIEAAAVADLEDRQPIREG